MMHFRNPSDPGRRRRLGPDFEAVSHVVHPKILAAARKASAALTRAGVRHVLIGGLAVGAYGHPRATKDVDFLVGPEAFEDNSGILTFAPGVPFAVDGVAVDNIPPSPEDPFLEDILDSPLSDCGMPIASAEVIVYLKLRAGRRIDLDDVVKMLGSGSINPNTVGTYLHDYAPELLSEFEHLLFESEQR